MPRRHTGRGTCAARGRRPLVDRGVEVARLGVLLPGQDAGDAVVEQRTVFRADHQREIRIEAAGLGRRASVGTLPFSV